jgi:hypothetical protein
VKAWQSQLDLTRPVRKIGLVWAGNPNHANDYNRSLALSQFSALTSLPDVQFYSLQTGISALEASSLPLHQLTLPLKDFADTAAFITHLDLIITVDTSVAHLAAAMEKPVWILLSYASDWRWLMHGTKSPWYPTVRLFRQSSPGDWSSVFQDLNQALAE